MALWHDARPGLLNRRTDILAGTLGTRLDFDLVAALARQAVADPDSVPHKPVLLTLVARLPGSHLDRLHGAMLLRTGNARDAALVLRAAIRNRTLDEPPVEELLLALALVKLDRRDEARKHLKTAADWMDDGTAPQRCTALLGARPAGPLAALAAVGHVPDLRLDPLDPFTGHELSVLRREVQRALAN